MDEQHQQQTMERSFEIPPLFPLSSTHPQLGSWEAGASGSHQHLQADGLQTCRSQSIDRGGFRVPRFSKSTTTTQSLLSSCSDPAAQGAYEQAIRGFGVKVVDHRPQDHR
ncbi:unnamed protein product [Calypogeia fissa]